MQLKQGQLGEQAKYTKFIVWCCNKPHRIRFLKIRNSESSARSQHGSQPAQAQPRRRCPRQCSSPCTAARTRRWCPSSSPLLLYAPAHQRWSCSCSLKLSVSPLLASGCQISDWWLAGPSSVAQCFWERGCFDPHMPVNFQYCCVCRRSCCSSWWILPYLLSY